MKKEKVSKKDLYLDSFNVAPGVWGLKDIFVNIYMIHDPASNHWFLVDAGLKTTAAKIKEMAEHLFWPDVKPAAIILTHAHFDHVGSLKALAEEWHIPVYAHSMEKPYLTDMSSYPPADPSVGGGLMSTLSWAYPKGPINIEGALEILPEDGTIPGLPEWKAIHTPGHAPGHISLYRERDKVLLVGDAFVTTKAESAVSTMLQSKILSGPPKYFTYDWSAAAKSVRALAALNPEIVSTGHGKPMQGEEMRSSLHKLADRFEELAVPSSGRYVDAPAVVNAEGVQYVPPAHTTGLILTISGFAAAALIGFFAVKQYRKKAEHKLLGFSFN